MDRGMKQIERVMKKRIVGRYCRMSGFFCACCLAVALASCAGKKSLTEGASGMSGSTAGQTSQEIQQKRFLQGVIGQAVYQKNIVGSMSFRLKAGNIDQSLPGSLHMRKDEVIRLQVFIPLIGTEVGRIEFTPEYVLVVDRIHKEYIKADYRNLAFLRENGLDFYSLQSLFWNQLLLPGTRTLSEKDLSKLTVTLDDVALHVPISYTKDKLSFYWKAERASSHIVATEVQYEGHSGVSKLLWSYGDFKTLGLKQFPASQSFSFITKVAGKQQQAVVSFSLSKLGTQSDWETKTTLSSKYRQVEASDVFDKLLNFK